MKKVAIIGGGIAGLSAGIYLQKAGYQAEIFEKNAVIGGQCTCWKRDGYTIDNCIHWLTGTKEGNQLNEVWKEIGALGKTIGLHKKEMFFCAEDGEQRITFWRDIERTRRELLELSPEDEVEINKLIDYTKLAANFVMPTEKPFDMMNPIDLLKMMVSMKDMGAVMREYGNINIADLGTRFQHPLIRRAVSDYMPTGYQAYAFLVSYATVISENGDVPEGGSLAMSLRIADRFQQLGGIIHTNTSVDKIQIDGNKAKGLVLQNGAEVTADYIICACDSSFTFGKLLDPKYMPKELKTLYDMRTTYPVISGFQVAFAIDGLFPEIRGTRFFPTQPLTIATSHLDRMSTTCYDYEPAFAPEGKTVMQSNFIQTERDFDYWKKQYENKEEYKKEKERIANQILDRLIQEYPMLEGKARVLDVWTPVTYARYCNSYYGSYMSFIMTKNAKSITVPGKLKGLHNVFLGSQWQMGPGGLPTAAVMGKHAAYRVIKSKK